MAQWANDADDGMTLQDKVDRDWIDLGFTDGRRAATSYANRMYPNDECYPIHTDDDLTMRAESCILKGVVKPTLYHQAFITAFKDAGEAERKRRIAKSIKDMALKAVGWERERHERPVKRFKRIERATPLPCCELLGAPIRLTLDTFGRLG